MLVALRFEFLDTGDLITCCAIITGDFRFDDDHGGDFIGDTNMWCLSKAWEPLSTIGFPVRDRSTSQLVLNGIFLHFFTKIRVSITVRNEWATEIPLVEEDRIGDIFSRSMLKGTNAVMRVKLGKAMHHAVSLLRSASCDILNGHPYQSLNAF